LKSCVKHKVKRVVITSSSLTVCNPGPGKNKSQYDENDWSDPNYGPPYDKSKTQAEKAAWDF